MYFIGSVLVFGCSISSISLAAPIPVRLHSKINSIQALTVCLQQNQNIAEINTRNWLDDVLKIITAKEPLIVPLIVARKNVAEINIRSWGDDVIELLAKLNPFILPRIAGRNDVADQGYETNIRERQILKPVSEFADFVYTRAANIAENLVGSVELSGRKSGIQSSARRGVASTSDDNHRLFVMRASHQLDRLEDSAATTPSGDSYADRGKEETVNHVKVAGS